MNQRGNQPAVQAQTWVSALMGFSGQALRIAELSVAPVVDLVIRLWLAQVFFVSGILKISNWENALFLSANEYPVSWMDPVTAAYLGVSIELAGSVLLALGLATRFAAAPMLILSLIIQFNYRALDVHLFWAILFGWYLVRGAGALSFDRMFARGLADSALPFAAAGMRIAESVTRYLGPVYQLLLRLCIAACFVVAARYASMPGHAELWLPLKSAADFPAFAALLFAALLIAGLATRVAALLLIALVLLLGITGAELLNEAYWLMIFALIALHGAGEISLDTPIEAKLKKLFPQLEGKPAFSLEGLPRVVIVGAGFGGLSCAAGLRNSPVQVTLIDQHNYHLFQPLLYQVATAALAPGDIATPIRGMFREAFNTRVLLGRVTGVDTERQEVLIGEKRIPYDYLVLASGARHSYFGRDEWEPYAPGLKRVEDATEVRRRLLVAFEKAENTDDPEERNKLLTFIIVGAGPTGVELAGAIAELARFGMERDFRHFDPATARVILVQSAPRILPMFPERLSEIAKASLEKLGVEVLTDSRVDQVDDEGALIKGNRIHAGTVLWAAGVVASPAAAWVKGEQDSAGRLKVAPDLSVPGLPDVYAIGDTALSNAWEGRPVPGLAPAAKQGGVYVAKVLRARVTGRTPPAPFSYFHAGSLATIGRKAAIADFGSFKVSGTLAWWFWGMIHIYFLVGLRNRLSVMFDWFWAYLTYRSGTRLITGAREEA